MVDINIWQSRVGRKTTWKWNITSKLREYELKVPCFELLMSCAFAHSLTYTKLERIITLKHFSQRESTSLTMLKEHTSKTISWKRPSISLSHNKILDFIWPTRLSMEISQEMLCWIFSIFKIGTLAWGINCSLYHPPAKRNFKE